MRTLSALLMVLLLCSLQQTCSGTEAINTPVGCCFNFVEEKNIPFRRIVSYSETSSNCPKRAVVFKTVKGKELCVDPKNARVKEYMKKLKA